MKLSNVLASISLATAALAAPARLVPARLVNRNNGVTDVDVLQFALTLEYLEITLYELGVTTFGPDDFESAGYPDAFARFQEIINQELDHISNIQMTIEMLGGTPTQPCTYDFGPLPDVQAFLNATDAVNGLGPSAYIGTGPYISDAMVLTVGSSIGQNEARHNSWLNGVIGRDEFPTAYQLPLNPTQVYGVASPFIRSCPDSNPKLKIVTAYPPGLKVTNPGVPAAPLYGGQSVNLQPAPEYQSPGGTVNVAFLYSLNTTIVPFDGSSALIPDDCAGQAYAILTTASPGETLNDGNSLTGPAPFIVDVPASRFADYRYQQGTY